LRISWKHRGTTRKWKQIIEWGSERKGGREEGKRAEEKKEAEKKENWQEYKSN
jgi:hypothetical protein